MQHTSTHVTMAVVIAVMLVVTAVNIPSTNAMPTLGVGNNRESSFARRDASFPDMENIDMLGRLLYLTQKYKHQISAMNGQKFKRQEDIIPCLWNAVSCYRKRK